MVEDDADLRRLLRRGLDEEGFEVVAVARGAEAIAVAAEDPPDVLVVDIGLPDADGRDVCQALRAQGLEAPVLFLTARDAVTDRLSGFSAGGDDYLTKPFALAELVARLRALLKRSGLDSTTTVGDLVLDPVTHAAACEQRRASPSPRPSSGCWRRSRLGPARRSGVASSSERRGPTERSSTTTPSTSTWPGCGESSASSQHRPEFDTVFGVGYQLR